MSLTVSQRSARPRREGEVDDAAFVAGPRLPAVRLDDDHRAGPATRRHGAEFADNQTPPPAEAGSGPAPALPGQRRHAGRPRTPLRGRLAFQNCHRVAVFDPAATGRTRSSFTPRAQILNQSPDWSTAEGWRPQDGPGKRLQVALPPESTTDPGCRKRIPRGNDHEPGEQPGDTPSGSATRVRGNALEGTTTDPGQHLGPRAALMFSRVRA